MATRWGTTIGWSRKVEIRHHAARTSDATWMVVVSASTTGVLHPGWCGCARLGPRAAGRAGGPGAIVYDRL
ncbi:hypothetical protein GCM10009834_23440 [Streptomonospora arabica]|uniref:Uncharacterized protein n=1 Tax=Streptomonospora halophila TaxID=427369 RepID=A0ABP9GEW1_9ACTN